jgi:hypothetical protein
VTAKLQLKLALSKKTTSKSQFSFFLFPIRRHSLFHLEILIQTLRASGVAGSTGAQIQAFSIDRQTDKQTDRQTDGQTVWTFSF